MTSFKRIGEMLGLKLPPSSQEAIHALVQEREMLSLNTPGVLFDISKDAWKGRLRSTTEVYKLIKIAENELKLTEEIDDHNQWIVALYFAREADKKIKPLMEHKFHKLVIPDMGIGPVLTFGSYANMLLLGSFVGPFVLSYILSAFPDMTPEAKDTVRYYYLTLLILPSLMGFGLDECRTWITSLLTYSMTDHVLDAAKKAGVTLDLSYTPSVHTIKMLQNEIILNKAQKKLVNSEAFRISEMVRGLENALIHSNDEDVPLTDDDVYTTPIKNLN